MSEYLYEETRIIKELPDGTVVTDQQIYMWPDGHIITTNTPIPQELTAYHS